MKKIVITHIINDKKFLASPIEQFTVFNNTYNYFCCLDSKSKTEEISYELYSVINVKTEKDLQKKIHETKCDILVMHSYFISPLLLYRFRKKKILWISWGYDIYTNKLLKFIDFNKISVPFYKYKTQQWWAKNVLLKDVVKCLLNLPKTLFNKFFMLKKIDYISTVIPIEYSMLRLTLGLDINHFDFRYINNKKITNSISKLGNDILLGNSADPSNNHFDLLAILAKNKVKNKLVLPMSYGNLKYRDSVIKYGLSKKIEAFEPLTDFMAYDEYRKKLLNCSYLVMGHLRQQAMGNIFLGFQLGMKVFLFEESIVYKYLKECGFIIYAIESINFNSFTNPLSMEDKRTNLDLYNEILNKDKYNKEFENSFNTLVK